MVEHLTGAPLEQLAEAEVFRDALGWGLGWGLADDVVWHWGEMDYFSCVAVASRAERRGLVCLTNGDEGLSACADILGDVLGEQFAYPIRAVLERGW